LHCSAPPPFSVAEFIDPVLGFFVKTLSLNLGTGQQTLIIKQYDRYDMIP
jgi:hypothetical protein